MSPALDYFSKTSGAMDTNPTPAAEDDSTKSIHTDTSGNYYNPRLDPKNYPRRSPLRQPRLRQMLARPGIVVTPGICDGISARCALEAGFNCLYQSGAATTASRMVRIDGLQPRPVIADADTGFGGPTMVARTVTQYARCGAAGLHIEDQVQTKRCGHLLGKQVVSREEFITRIRAAVIARDSIPGGSDFVIIGRTDSAQVPGMEEAVERLKLAAAAGADVCFIEGVKSKDLLEKTVAALAPKPVLVNVISGGLTPPFTYKEAEEMGAKIILGFPTTQLLSRCSLLTCILRGYGARLPRGYAVSQEDWY
ncbi:Phosphoenolpyruvate/pyruvate domain-containing protein [Pleurotus eryngii]|uniref:Phosphoenolpyruvate/pyruvate domain-containing protein n=1 Tax=Pleurotus eryngii TaxID=5323 RepID=A0A9P6A8N9_PLEER|nr:Phosphoenolpyruvate/pyruvate domain-containing protein [Pleurotus eryngii]